MKTTDDGAALRIAAVSRDARDWATRTVAGEFVSFRVVSRGVLHDTRMLPGLVAIHSGDKVGLLHYHIDAEDFEVVTLIALQRRQGVGTALLEAAELIAREASCHRMWLVTTNNNTGALGFYRAIGWRQVRVHRGAVAEARRLKPELPETDAAGRPIEDEIEFEKRLT